MPSRGFAEEVLIMRNRRGAGTLQKCSKLGKLLGIERKWSGA
jgi:hypothetical protein